MTRMYKYLPIDMDDISRHMDHYINKSWSVRGFLPSSDIVVQSDSITITLEIPGVDKENLDISLSPEGVLTIKGNKKNPKEYTKEDHKLSERFWGTFERSFTIGRDYDFDQIDARLDRGVLTLYIPKNQHLQSESQKIQIND